MDNNTILTYIIAIAIVVVVALIIFYEMKNSKDGDKKVQNFLESIKDSLLEVIVAQIGKFDVTVLKDQESLENFEKQFLDSVYSTAIKTTLDQLEAIKPDHPVTYAIIKKTITEDKIKKYIDTLFSDQEIQPKIEQLYATAFAAKMKKIEEDDKKLEAEQDIYDNGLDNSVETEPVELNIDPDRGVQKEDTIIPPSDAASMVVDETDEEISKEEFDKYNEIANKGLIDTHHKPIEVINKE